MLTNLVEQKKPFDSVNKIFVRDQNSHLNFILIASIKNMTLNKILISSRWKASPTWACLVQLEEALSNTPHHTSQTIGHHRIIICTTTTAPITTIIITIIKLIMKFSTAAHSLSPPPCLRWAPRVKEALATSQTDQSSKLIGNCLH